MVACRKSARAIAAGSWLCWHRIRQRNSSAKKRRWPRRRQRCVAACSCEPGGPGQAVMLRRLCGASSCSMRWVPCCCHGALLLPPHNYQSPTSNTRYCIEPMTSQPHGMSEQIHIEHSYSCQCLVQGSSPSSMPGTTHGNDLGCQLLRRRHRLGLDVMCLTMAGGVMAEWRPGSMLAEVGVPCHSSPPHRAARRSFHL